jgi:hypothetical protein
MISSSSIFAKLSKKVLPSGDARKYNTDKPQTTRNQGKNGVFISIDFIINQSRQSITVGPVNDVEIRLNSIGSAYNSPLQVHTVSSNQVYETPEKLGYLKSPIFGYQHTPKISSFKSEMAKKNLNQLSLPNNSVNDTLKDYQHNKV